MSSEARADWDRYESYRVSAEDELALSFDPTERGFEGRHVAMAQVYATLAQAAAVAGWTSTFCALRSS